MSSHACEPLRQLRRRLVVGRPTTAATAEGWELASCLARTLRMRSAESAPFGAVSYAQQQNQNLMA